MHEIIAMVIVVGTFVGVTIFCDRLNRKHDKEFLKNMKELCEVLKGIENSLSKIAEKS